MPSGSGQNSSDFSQDRNEDGKRVVWRTWFPAAEERGQLNFPTPGNLVDNRENRDGSRPTYYNRVTGIFTWVESDARVKTSNKCCNNPVDWAARQPEGQAPQ
jgi:hypothetical protein